MFFQDYVLHIRKEGRKEDMSLERIFNHLFDMPLFLVQ